VHSRLKSISLIAVTLLLPSCTAPQKCVPTPAFEQAVAPTQAAHAPRRGDNSPVVQAAHRQDGEPNAVVDPAATPSETLPLPEPIAGNPVGPAPLSLFALEQMAMQNNPSIAESRAKVAAMRGKWLQAGLLPNPRLGYSGQQIGSRGEAEQQGVYMEQEFIRGGKLRLDRAVTSREIGHAQQLLEVQRRRVLTDVRMGYYTVICAQRRVDITEELVRIGKQATKAAEHLLDKQEGSRRDLLQARIESRSAEIFLQQARNQHLAAWRMLAAVLGSPEMPPVPLAGDLDETDTALAWEQSIQRLLSESPEIAAAFLQVERARWAIDRAHAQAVPDVNVQGIVQHDNSTGSSNGSLLVSLPIPVLNRNQGGIRQAESELVSAEMAARRVELALHRRLAPVFERYLTSRNRVDSYRDGILRDAQESLDLTRQGYEGGELSFLNLLTAQRTYFQANLDFVDALCGMWAASTEIEGLLLTNSLEAGESSGGSPQPAPSSDSNVGLPSMAGQL
jgi:cobalt-zinc-cadmium efflux system outer membrane protein